MARKPIGEVPGKQLIGPEDFRLADEIRHMQRRAAAHERCFLTVGAVALFSTESGDAWLLHPQDHLASRLAREGDPEWVYFEEGASRFVIAWHGRYRVEGETFVYIDHDSGRTTTILGYPTRQIAQLG